MISHPLLAVAIILIVIQALLSWSSWYRKRYYKRDGCRICGTMIEMHRELTLDDETVWKGQCDYCYNHVTEFMDHNE